MAGGTGVDKDPLSFGNLLVTEDDRFGFIEVDGAVYFPEGGGIGSADIELPK